MNQIALRPAPCVYCGEVDCANIGRGQHARAVPVADQWREHVAGRIDRVDRMLGEAAREARDAEMAAEGLAGQKREQVVAALKAARQALHDARKAVDDALYDARLP